MKWYLKAMRQYADFHGRARRMEFWMFSLFSLVIALGLITLMMLIGSMANSLEVVGPIVGTVLGFYYLGAIIPTWAVTARRLHDTGNSGWLQLIGIIPFIGALVLLILCCTDGYCGPNKYGPDPKAEYATLS